MEYNFKDIENKWQKYWAENKTFKTETTANKPKYYVLDMFPYPSGAGLHVGHPLGYIASDIVARYKRLKGFNVLHPMGYDSFGLPAEQYAIQTGQHPAVTTEQNIKRYREQLDKLGFSFDWDREVRTSDPNYYKWTQWIFIQLFNSWYNPETNKAESIEELIKKFKAESLKFKVGTSEKTFDELTEKEKSDVLMEHRLAYLSNSWVNWCPQLGTVLANEEVKDGVSERGGHPVERKLMPQWSLRITAYADRLLTDLDGIDWNDSIKEAQRNWIGRSEGSSLTFKVQSSKLEISVFTTRPDTIFGVSFLTLAPEHELVMQITTPENKTAVEEYITFAKNRSERERQADVKKITGQFTGAYALHPFSGKQIPIWIGDYVLAGYGTGAVMAVPAHDTRDFAFAKHFGLDIIQVILPPSPSDKGQGDEVSSYDGKSGTLINSDFLNGLEVKAAMKKAIEEIEKKNLGKGKTNFRLRDAIFGRQRYWGEPIPIYYKDGIPYTVEEKHLPLTLPDVDKYLPTEDGEPPLARAKDWKYSPLLGRGAGGEVLETTTMPGWAGSSWYYLRYMDPKNEKEFVSKEAANYWQDVDLYIGGAEHATGHLLYVRFWTKFLNDLGLISVIEPAKKLINQGMIQGRSSFVYRLGFVGHIEDEIRGKTFKNRPLLFVSKKFSDNEYEHNKEVFSYYSEISKNSGINFSDSPSIRYHVFAPIHVDVGLVENDILDIEKFKNSSDEYKNAEFLLEDGKYICGSEVEKMSKSKWNVVTPDSICEQYGADCLRLYEMFLGPLEMHKPWNTNGITGVYGFLKKLWRLYHQDTQHSALNTQHSISDEPPTKPELKVLHKTIKKITEDIDRYSFNTSVSSFMICVNELSDLKCNKKAILEPLAIIIAPYAPHVAEELWSLLGHTESITYTQFPEFKEEYLVESSFNYPVSVNGKTRFFYELDLSLSKEDVEKEVMALEQTQKYLDGKAPKKVIVVPNKIVNIVV